jgi:hypothetical protein
MHGGMDNDVRIGATRPKRADLQQNCACLCIVKAGAMSTSQKVAKKISMAFFVLIGGNFL